MAATAGPRKIISIYDYPEHLNPFREDDNHKFRFWTMGRKLNRSNSLNFSGIKDLKNSWALRSFMKKGKKKESASAPPPTQEYTKPGAPSQTNGHGSSPIVFRRALQYSSMSEKRGHTSPPDRFVYGGSVTPLPRSRFQERLRSTSQYDLETTSLTPRMARSEVSGSRVSVESTNPFEEGPVPPVRMPRRKKKKAPPPPPPQRNLDISVTSITSETINEDSGNVPQTTINETIDDIDVEMAKLNIELKIIEDEDLNRTEETNNIDKSPKILKSPDKTPPNTPQNETTDVENSRTEKQTLDLANGNSEEDLLDDVSFPKVNIERYRRNSSVNEDEIRLRRGNLEDFPVLTFKRSKSLTNTSDTHHVIYDIDLNENVTHNTTAIDEPQKVICKVYEDPAQKQSIDNPISSTDRDLNDIDEATRQLQREISKLNTALNNDSLDVCNGNQKENGDAPNPIPKPRRSHHADKESFLKN